MEAETTAPKSNKRGPRRYTENLSNGLQFEFVAEAIARRRLWRLTHRHSRWGGVEADRLFLWGREWVWVEARWTRSPQHFDRIFPHSKITRLYRGADRLASETGKPVRLALLYGWGCLPPGPLGRWLLARWPEGVGCRYRWFWL